MRCFISRILRILLSCEIKSCEILPCHTFYVATWIIHKNIFVKLLKSPFLRKFSGIQYDLKQKNSYIVALSIYLSCDIFFVVTSHMGTYSVQHL